MRSQTAREFHELQRLMARAVMRPLTPADRMQSRWTDGRPTKKIAESFIKPNDRLTSFERLEIYNRQYWFRVKDCFYEDYPGLRAILGENKFERLALAYIEHCPSQSYTLRNLGSRLVKFLEARPNLVAPHKQLALDMARLEWAHTEAFDNAALPPLDTDDLLDANPAKLRLQMQPHLTLLKLSHAVDDFLLEVKHGAGLRSEASNAMEQGRKHSRARRKRKLARKETFIAVHRHLDSVYYKRLEAGQFLVLSALQNGATLNAACAKLLRGKKADAAALGETLKRWFANWSTLGWFCGVNKSQPKKEKSK
ncbi:MAG: hypothetical protein RLZZ350_2677 [Verrucomicrobiota bacterium]|jgi:hypothetical protein